MTTLREHANDQDTIWNGSAGHGWVAAQALTDRIFKPLEDLLAKDVQAASAKRVLDVGCGTGATTVAVAKRLGAERSVHGIDLSDVMIETARTRADLHGVSASFICANAQTHPFDAEPYDMIISRFGVMFFDDPVRAFKNLRSAASSDAALRCIVWRSSTENPFMTTAEQAAEPMLPGVSRRVPNEPGQFGFADSDRVRDILASSGWGEVQMTPIDVRCAFPLSDLDLYLNCLGPVGRTLQQEDSRTREKVIEAIRPAFAPYVRGSDVSFSAALWLIDARASQS